MWKDIKGYEGYYQINELGDVRSLDRVVVCGDKGGLMTRKGRIMDKVVNKDGYLNVGLSKFDKRKIYRIHRLVAETFLPNPENKPQVNHIDNDRKNNNVENLEWVTISENMYHAYRHGDLSKKGEKNGRSKLTEEKVKEIRLKYKNGISRKELSEQYMVSRSTIDSVVNKETWKEV